MARPTAKKAKVWPHFTIALATFVSGLLILGQTFSDMRAVRKLHTALEGEVGRVERYGTPFWFYVLKVWGSKSPKCYDGGGRGTVKNAEKVRNII